MPTFSPNSAPCDLVIIEGYKRDDHDKIEVRNLALDHPKLAGDDPTIVAIAATGPIADAPVPVFDRDDVTALAEFIIAHAGLTQAMTADDVIDTWYAAGEERWFAKDAAFDGMLSVRFKSALAEARNGAFDHWAKTPKGALGLVLLLDQISRNIHRGSPLAFAADAKACGLRRMSSPRASTVHFPRRIAIWFYLPFEHAEDIDCQMRCVALFTTRGPRGDDLLGASSISTSSPNSAASRIAIAFSAANRRPRNSPSSPPAVLRGRCNFTPPCGRGMQGWGSRQTLNPPLEFCFRLCLRKFTTSPQGGR